MLRPRNQDHSKRKGPGTAPFCLATLAAVFSLACLSPAQEQRGEELVADLAAGRVEIAVAKDGIVIGTLENPIEAHARPPLIVPMDEDRAGVLLGAADWELPDRGRDLARLEKELPNIRVRAFGEIPSLGSRQTEGAEAKDIEQIGLGLFSRLNNIVSHLHGKLDVPPNEPVVELVLADYVTDYGPEVWLLSYGLDQEPRQGDYWQTRTRHPEYLQLWPPEKTQPHTLIEIQYPPENASPSLLELLRTRDPRLERVRTAGPEMEEVSELLLHGESTNAPAASVLKFLRASLAAIAAPGEIQIVAVINKQSGFAWVVAPPKEAPSRGQATPREPGAPSLRRPPL